MTDQTREATGQEIAQVDALLATISVTAALNQVSTNTLAAALCTALGDITFDTSANDEEREAAIAAIVRVVRARLASRDRRKVIETAAAAMGEAKGSA